MISKFPCECSSAGERGRSVAELHTSDSLYALLPDLRSEFLGEYASGENRLQKELLDVVGGDWHGGWRTRAREKDSDASNGTRRDASYKHSHGGGQLKSKRTNDAGPHSLGLCTLYTSI